MVHLPLCLMKRTLCLPILKGTLRLIPHPPAWQRPPIPFGPKEKRVSHSCASERGRERREHGWMMDVQSSEVLLITAIHWRRRGKERGKGTGTGMGDWESLGLSVCQGEKGRSIPTGGEWGRISALTITFLPNQNYRSYCLFFFFHFSSALLSTQYSVCLSVSRQRCTAILFKVIFQA